MPDRLGRVLFRDTRSGRWRSPAPYEKNPGFVIDTLSRGIANFTFKTMDRIAEIAQDLAEELVTYAKENAPWEDRTGDARAGLESSVEVQNGEFSVELYHTVDYGFWLEVRWGGRYAIIIPTVETIGPRLFQRMNNMISEIYYP